MLWLRGLFHEKEQWQVPSQTDWDEENEEGKPRSSALSPSFFVESQGGLDSEGAAGEVPPTKVWQRSGMGQPSKGDSKGHPWVEENLERQQIPITHTINSGACRYLIFYRVTAEQNKGISVLLLINTAPRVWEIKQPPPWRRWNLFF